MAFLDIPGKERRNRSVIGTGSRKWRQEFRPVGRQAALHKQITMKITEKVQRRTRNVIITLTIICLTPLCEKGRILSGAHSVNAFAGEELVCAIDLGDEMYSSHGLETGLNYRLLNKFAEANHCNVKIIASGSKDNYLDSLRQGKVDLVVTHSHDLTGVNTLSKINDCSSWAVNTTDMNKVRQLNNWIGHMKTSSEFERLENLFSRVQSPHKRAEKGVITSRVSPYDDLIREYSEHLGWDWRLLAAVVYQESKFSINSVSHRGAKGLMQVMPQTGRHYGVEDLTDPKQNLLAGTMHLKRLQNLYIGSGMEKEDLIRFTLAAYNAGEGRIKDCRNFASSQGKDRNSWNAIVDLIPLMREDAILENEAVKLGKFKGYETIAYVESIMSLYESICTIHPSI